MSQMFTLDEVQKILNASIHVSSQITDTKNAYIHLSIENVCTDSRKLDENCLFIALKGDNFDAHDFIAELNQKQVVAVVVQKIIPNIDMPQILVDNTKTALQKLANYWRNQFDIPMVAVVGSNGKTTVKEMIYHIFKYAEGTTPNENLEQCIATIGNLNNDIGLPLSILKLNDKHKLAVFEIGINHPQETITLAAVLEPTIAIINNAQREHQEFMESVEMVATEHGYLLEQTSKLKHAILPYDSPFFEQWQAQCNKNNIPVTSFGLEEGSKLEGTEGADVKGFRSSNPDLLTVFIRTKKSILASAIELQVVGLHNSYNALAAVAAGHCVGIYFQNIIYALEHFTAVKGRLQKSIMQNNIQLINDTYNANPDSVKAAIDVLADISKNSLLVLGDMGEVGNQGKEFHKEIGAYAKNKGISYLCTLGELSCYSCQAFYDSSKEIEENIYKDIEQIKECILTFIRVNKIDTILVKGSRFMKMERIVEWLQTEKIA